MRAKPQVLVIKDGVPHWWCNECKCWHPVVCPNEGKR